jgi:hypothetical protein
MGLLDSLKGIFSGGGGGGGSTTSDGFYFYVRCPRAHPIRIWVNRGQDLARDFETDGYTLTKHVVCPTCFQKTLATLHFNDRYREQGREIEGGTFIEESDYEAAQPRQPGQAPGEGERS